MHRAVAACFFHQLCVLQKFVILINPGYSAHFFVCGTAVLWLVFGYILYPFGSCLSSLILISPRESPIAISYDLKLDSDHGGESSGLGDSQK